MFGFIGKAVRAVGRAIGRGVEIVGEKTGFKPLEDLGRGIQDICRETSVRTGQSASYDRDTASEAQTVNVADILSSFSLGLKGQATTIEQQSKQYVEDYFDGMIQGMESALGDCAATRNLKSQKRLIVQSIDGQLSNVLARRVALTDSECLAILSLQPGTEKERKMDAFGRKVIQEGLNNLASALETSLTSASESVTEELDAAATEQRQDLERLIEQLNAVTEKRMKDSGNAEEAMLSLANKLTACDLALKLMEEQEIA